MYLVLNDQKKAEKDAKGWTVHRLELEDLYVIQGWTLAAIQNHMRESHGFEASLDMYKRRFKQWRFRKNKREDEMKAANWRRHQPDRLGRPTIIKIRDNFYTDADLDSYFRRRSRHTGRLQSPIAEPSVHLLSDLTCITPGQESFPSSTAVSANPESSEELRLQVHEGSEKVEHQGRPGSRTRHLKTVKGFDRRLRPRTIYPAHASSLAYSLPLPEPFRHIEPALMGVSDLFDVWLHAEPIMLKNKFSEPTVDALLFPLISAMGNLHTGNSYKALSHLRKSCTGLESSRESLDLSLLVDLVSSPSLLGNSKIDSPQDVQCSISPLENPFEGALVVFLKHLHRVSALRLGTKHPITLVSAYLCNSPSRSSIARSICDLITQKLSQCLSPYHVATIKMRRRVARLPLYTVSSDLDLDVADSSLTRLLSDCQRHLPASAPHTLPTLRQITMDLSLILEDKKAYSRIPPLFTSNIHLLFTLDPHSFFAQDSMLRYDILETSMRVSHAHEQLGNISEAELILRRLVSLLHGKYGASLVGSSCDSSSSSSRDGGGGPKTSSAIPTAAQTDRKDKDNDNGIWNDTTLDATRRLVEFLERQARQTETEQFVKFLEVAEARAREDWDRDKDSEAAVQ